MSLARAVLLALAAFSPAPDAAAEEKPVQAYGIDHPACAEWSDGCLVCARRAEESAACSMVGTACRPAATVCLKEERDAAGK